MPLEQFDISLTLDIFPSLSVELGEPLVVEGAFQSLDGISDFFQLLPLFLNLMLAEIMIKFHCQPGKLARWVGCLIFTFVLN